MPFPFPCPRLIHPLPQHRLPNLLILFLCTALSLPRYLRGSQHVWSVECKSCELYNNSSGQPAQAEQQPARQQAAQRRLRGVVHTCAATLPCSAHECMVAFLQLFHLTTGQCVPAAAARSGTAADLGSGGTLCCSPGMQGGGRPDTANHQTLAVILNMQAGEKPATLPCWADLLDDRLLGQVFLQAGKDQR